MQPYLEELVIEEQQYLEKDENLEKIFSVIMSICVFKKETEKKNLLELSYQAIKEISGSKARWYHLKSLFKKNKQDNSLWAAIEKELTIGLLYPKIDSHVSAQANHLLKCPFNVHHDTGKLSLPILDIENFDVNKCPTIFDALENGGEEMMKPYLEAFDRFCEPLINGSQNIDRRD